MSVLHHGWAQMFTHWQVYALAVVGITGLALVQSAFQAGPLTASQPALIIGDPVASILLGVWLFNDKLGGSTEEFVVALVGLAVMVAGVFVLSRSPQIVGADVDEMLHWPHGDLPIEPGFEL